MTAAGRSTVLLTISSALIAALLSGAGTYAYERHQATKMRNDLQSQINTLHARLIESLNYENTDFGFKLTFPERFARYVIMSRGASADMSQDYTIFLPTKDPTYAQGVDGGPKGYAPIGDIGVFSQDQYASLQQEIAANNGNAGFYNTLGSTSLYSMAFESSEIAPNDWTDQDMAAVYSIPLSFKISANFVSANDWSREQLEALAYTDLSGKTRLVNTGSTGPFILDMTGVDDQAVADVNGDGDMDRIVTIYEHDGSSVFPILAAITDKNGQPVVAAETGMLGDRAIVSSITVKDGLITVTGLVHAAGQAMSDAPTQAATETYRLEGNKLVAPAA